MGATRTVMGCVTLAALVLLGAACGSSSKGASPTTAAAAAATTVAASTTTSSTTPPTTTTSSSTSTTAAAATRYYLSLGDSYASGYQPDVGNTTAGFTYQVEAMAKASPHPLTLFNVGCAGATTTSLLDTKGCPAAALGPGATPYNTETQIAAAESFLRAHPGAVGLITVSIGGNDVTKCARDPNVAQCLAGALTTVNTNLPVIAKRLRDAAGPQTLIVGTTYPDVILGEWVSGTPNGQQLAKLSVGAFQSLINPALAKAYSAVGARFVDVTAATGAYGPLTNLTNLPPYGSIPVPVARVCQLTHFCALQDIHPNPAGYKVIASLVYATYTKSQAG